MLDVFSVGWVGKEYALLKARPKTQHITAVRQWAHCKQDHRC